MIIVRLQAVIGNMNLKDVLLLLFSKSPCLIEHLFFFLFHICTALCLPSPSPPFKILFVFVHL